MNLEPQPKQNMFHSFSSEMARGEKGKICGNCLTEQTGSGLYESAHTAIFVFICSVHFFICMGHIFCLQRFFFICSFHFFISSVSFLFYSISFLFAAFLLDLQCFFFICSESLVGHRRKNMPKRSWQQPKRIKLEQSFS